MKKIRICALTLLLAMLISMVASCSSPQYKAEEEPAAQVEKTEPLAEVKSVDTVKVVTFNIQMNLTVDSNGNYRYISGLRMRAVADELLSYDADVIGLQEDHKRWVNYLTPILNAAGYKAYSGDLTATQSGNDYCERLTIFYRKNISIKEKGVRELPYGNMTGTVGSVKDDFINYRSMRYIVGSTVNGNQFLYVNTHIQHRGQGSTGIFQAADRIQARLLQWAAVESNAKTLRSKYPFASAFITGDLNDAAVGHFSIHDTTANAKAFGITNTAAGATGTVSVPMTFKDDLSGTTKSYTLKIPYEVKKVENGNVYFTIQSPCYGAYTKTYKDSFAIAQKTNATSSNKGSWNEYKDSKSGKGKSSGRLDYCLTMRLDVVDYQIGTGYVRYTDSTTLKNFTKDSDNHKAGKLTASNAVIAYDLKKSGTTYTATGVDSFLNSGGVYVFKSLTATSPSTVNYFISYNALSGETKTAAAVEIATSDHLPIVVTLGFPTRSYSKVDTSWYSDTKTEFNLVNANEVAGLNKLYAVDKKTFEGKTIRICTDMDMRGYQWKSGAYTDASGNTVAPVFLGTVDGGGHTIYNLTQNTTSLFGGFFSWIGENAVIKNLTFEGASISAGRNVGVVAGCVAKSNTSLNFPTVTVNNISVVDSVIQGASHSTSALIGRINSSKVKLNVSDINITGTTVISSGNQVAFIIGSDNANQTVSISKVTIASSTLHGENKKYVGAIYGQVENLKSLTLSDITVENDVTITGKTMVGGAVGSILYNMASTNGILTCTDISISATVTAESEAGGIIGSLERSNTKSPNAGVTMSMTMTRCQFRGNLQVSGTRAGGMVGLISSQEANTAASDMTATLTSCAVYGTIPTTGKEKSIGWVFGHVNAPITITGSKTILASEKADPRKTGNAGTTSTYTNQSVSVSAISPVVLTKTADLVDLYANIANYQGKVVILKTDLDMSGVSHSFSVNTIFSGTFEGNGHTIKNLTHALFHKVEGSTTIRNLTLEKSTINRTNNGTGTVANIANGTALTMQNVFVKNANVTGKLQTGGLVGQFGCTAPNYITVKATNCAFTGTLTADRLSGGLFGQVNRAKVTAKQCMVNAKMTFQDVEGSGTVRCGGLLGHVTYVPLLDLSHCLVTGSITVKNATNNTDTGAIAGLINNMDQVTADYVRTEFSNILAALTYSNVESIFGNKMSNGSIGKTTMTYGSIYYDQNSKGLPKKAFIQTEASTGAIAVPKANLYENGEIRGWVRNSYGMTYPAPTKELAALLSETTTSISNAVRVVGVQAKANANGTTDYRVIAALKNPKSNIAIGFTVNVAGVGEDTSYSREAYTSILGTVNGVSTTYRAEDFDADYLFVAVLQGVPDNQTFTVSVTPVVATQSGGTFATPVNGRTVELSLSKGVAMQIMN